MKSKILAGAATAAFLLASAPAGAFESDYSNLPKTGVVTIPSSDPVIIYEVFGQIIGVGVANIQASAIQGPTTINLVVTAVDQANTSTGVTNYFSLDGGPLCTAGGDWLVTTNVVGGGATFASTSTFLSCSP